MLYSLLKQNCWFLLILSYSFVSAQQNSISLEVKEASLEEVITQLEKQTSFLFTYKASDIESVKISVKAEGIDINSFLQTTLKNTGIDYEIVNGNYVLLSQSNTPVLKEGPPLSTLRGSVVDSLSGQSLGFASIYLKNSSKGIYSEENGSFKFKVFIKETDTLVISYVGYKEVALPAIAFTKKPYPKVELSIQEFGEEFVIVTDYMTDGIDLAENGASTVIRPNIMGTLPGQVEPDVLSTIQSLPGIASPDETASDIYIRGGTPDQNLILWEDIPIYHSAHYFGLISAFNPFIMDKVKVYRSGFGAEYGGRISGIVDLQSEPPALEQSVFGVGTNFTHTYTYGKVKLLNKKASIIYSLRRAITDVINTPTFENYTRRNLQGSTPNNFDISNLPRHIQIDNAFNFLDANVKASFQLTNKDKLSIAWFYGNNEFGSSLEDTMIEAQEQDNLFLSNQGASLKWERQYSDQFSIEATGIISDLNYDYDFDVQTSGNMAVGPDQFGIKRSDVNEKRINLAANYLTKQQHKINLGYQYGNYNVFSRITQESQETEQVDKTLDYQADLHTAFAEFKSSQDKRFTVNLGTRLNYYDGTDKLYFEPRVSVNYKLTDALSLHANAGKYHQFLSRLIEFKTDVVGIDNPIWVLSGFSEDPDKKGKREIPVLSSSMVQAGIVFNKNTWVIDVQSYLKEISGLTSLSVGFDLIPREDYDRGLSTIKGLDVLIKKRWRNYRTWISYCLSKVDYHFDDFSNQPFAAPYDQRHAFSITNQFSYKNWEFSVGWKASSGKPYSVMRDFEVRPGPNGNPRTFPIYDDFNSANLPLQHHLDASILYQFQSKGHAKGRGTIGVSLFNIYNKRNIYFREYYLDRRPNNPINIKIEDRAKLGFTPNLVFRFEWGK